MAWSTSLLPHIDSIIKPFPFFLYKPHIALPKPTKIISLVPQKTNYTRMEKEPSSCLKLFGSWASSYTHRVQLALKLKGLEFEYIEEDLANKSPSLLLHNPVYKKVPVLLHREKPIRESLIILQYIDELWPSSYPIMPTDPYERSLVRFWSHFADDKLGPVVGAVFASSGEAQKAAVEQVHENLKLVEKELRDGAFRGRRFFGGEKIGLLDIVLGCGSYWLAVFEEVADVKLVDAESFPLFHSWLREFEEEEEVKETIPSFDKLIEYARAVRTMLLNVNGEAEINAAAAAGTTSTNCHNEASSDQCVASAASVAADGSNN